MIEELKKLVKQYLPNEDLSLLEKAFDYASKNKNLIHDA